MPLPFLLLGLGKALHAAALKAAGKHVAGRAASGSDEGQGPPARRRKVEVEVKVEAEEQQEEDAEPSGLTPNQLFSQFKAEVDSFMEACVSRDTTASLRWVEHALTKAVTLDDCLAKERKSSPPVPAGTDVPTPAAARATTPVPR